MSESALPRTRRLKSSASTAIAALVATAGLTTASAMIGAPQANAAAVGKGAQCNDTSTVGGNIQRCQILKRAQYWVDNAVPYDQGGSASDLQGTGYRTDCSGYVAMAWHLPKVGGLDRIVSIPADREEINTGLSTDVVTNITDKSQLQPGDAMEIKDHHALIFNGWVDSTMTKYYAYEESNSNDRTHQDDGVTPYLSNGVSTVQSPVTYPYWSGIFPSGTQYIPVKYNGTQDNVTIPAGFNVTIDANGAPLAGGQNLSGTVNLTAKASSQGIINTLTYKITGPNGYDNTFNGGSGATDYAQPWNTTGLSNGNYSISVTANEVDGQDHTYGPVGFAVTNGPAAPTVSVTSPAAGATVFGLLNLTAAVSDSTSGATLSTQYYFDDNPIASSIDTTTVPDGVHTIKATATATLNGISKSTTSAPVTIDVENPGRGVAGAITPATSDPKATSVGDASGKMNVFTRGTDGHLYDSYAAPGGQWNLYDITQYASGPTIAGTPTAVLDSANVLNVFSRGTNGHLYDSYVNASGVWNQADLTTSSGAPTITSDPTVIVDTSGKMNVFTRGVDGHLYDTYAAAGALWNDSDLTVNSGAPTITDSPAVTTDTSGKMNVFTRGTDSHLYDTYAAAGALWNDSDLTVNSGAPTIIGEPAVTVDTSGKMNVFTRGVDGHLYDTYAAAGALWNDSDLTVNSGAPTITTAPSVTVDRSGTMNVYTRGTDGHLYDTYAAAGALWNDYDLTAHGAGPAI